MSDTDKKETRQLLKLLENLGMEPGRAADLLKVYHTPDLGYAKVDSARGWSAALPEVVMAPGKTAEEVVKITERLLEVSALAMVSRLNDEQRLALEKKIPGGTFHPRPSLFTAGEYTGPAEDDEGSVAVVSAGTSDLEAAEEAAVVLETMNVRTERFYDIGVAGIHRLTASLPGIRSHSICLVFAGMDAALPTILGGLYHGPVVAVPTSTGYGTAFGGVTALLSMLNSCSPGICVMNIDNGLGAAAAALRFIRRA